METVHIGKCLKKAMQDQKIIPSRVARDMGVSPQQMYNWTKQKNMCFDNVLKLANYFGYGLDEFAKLGNYE